MAAAAADDELLGEELVTRAMQPVPLTSTEQLRQREKNLKQKHGKKGNGGSSRTRRTADEFRMAE